MAPYKKHHPHHRGPPLPPVNRGGREGGAEVVAQHKLLVGRHRNPAHNAIQLRFIVPPTLGSSVSYRHRSHFEKQKQAFGS